jgi:hypothetical protein
MKSFQSSVPQKFIECGDIIVIRAGQMSSQGIPVDVHEGELRNISTF